MADDKPPTNAMDMTEAEYQHALRTRAWRKPPAPKPALPSAADLSEEEYRNELRRIAEGYYA